MARGSDKIFKGKENIDQGYDMCKEKEAKA